MKKTVAVCDAECRTLADGVCPLCERDFCKEHLCDRLLARFSLDRLLSQQPGTQPAKKLEAQIETETVVNICQGCARTLHGARFQLKGIFNDVDVDIDKKMIKECRAKLAEYKLAEQK